MIFHLAKKMLQEITQQTPTLHTHINYNFLINRSDLTNYLKHYMQTVSQQNP